MLDDFSACAREAHDAQPDPNLAPRRYPVGSNSVLGAALGAVIGEAIASAQATGKARRRFPVDCMYRRGYHAAPLTSAEQTEYAGRGQEEKVKWIDGFYASPNFENRLSAVVAPRLPEATNEPLTYGALRFDPATLVVHPGVVKVGEIVLRGNVAHRRTARLTSDVTFYMSSKDQMAAGTVVHQTLFPSADGPDRSYWCGPYRTRGVTIVACTRNDNDGYVTRNAAGVSWFATRLDPGEIEETPIDGAYALEESATDIAGTIDFAMVFRKISNTTVVLEALVAEGGHTESMWKMALQVGPDGRAILPFWTHRLVITPSGNGATAAFTPDGDGHGWPYAPAPE